MTAMSAAVAEASGGFLGFGERGGRIGFRPFQGHGLAAAAFPTLPANSRQRSSRDRPNRIGGIGQRCAEPECRSDQADCRGRPPLGVIVQWAPARPITCRSAKYAAMRRSARGRCRTIGACSPRSSRPPGPPHAFPPCGCRRRRRWRSQSWARPVSFARTVLSEAISSASKGSVPLHWRLVGPRQAPRQGLRNGLRRVAEFAVIIACDLQFHFAPLGSIIAPARTANRTCRSL